MKMENGKCPVCGKNQIDLDDYGLRICRDCLYADPRAQKIWDVAWCNSSFGFRYD